MRRPRQPPEGVPDLVRIRRRRLRDSKRSWRAQVCKRYMDKTMPRDEAMILASSRTTRELLNGICDVLVELADLVRALDMKIV